MLETEGEQRPLVLLMCVLTPAQLARVEQHYRVIQASVACDNVIRAHATDLRVVLTTGGVGLTAMQMNALPKLGLVCVLGTGYEGVDVAHARRHGISLGSSAGANADVVADHAMALLLAIVRRIRSYDKVARTGMSRVGLDIPMQVSGKRMGILGMGKIGKKIAERAQGFGMEVASLRRGSRSVDTMDDFDSLQALAKWADFLMVTVPGGPETFHMVDASILRALGPTGYLVNVARGSVVDTHALIEALNHRELGGAGLDVYEGEPYPSEALSELDHLVLTPHIAGHSPESSMEMVERFLQNAEAYFAGKTLPFAIEG